MKPEVFYNNQCSVCKLEIDHYKKSNIPFKWIDIHSLKNKNNDLNISLKTLARRLHVKENEKIYVGVDAFVIIWSKIPKYRILAKLIKLPFIYQISLIFYEIIAFFLYIKNYSDIKKL